MNKLTSLTSSECFGYNKLDILNQRRVDAIATDFFRLLGGWVHDNYIYNDVACVGVGGGYWTNSNSQFYSDKAVAVADYGYCTELKITNRYPGVRPGLPFSSIDEIPTNGEKAKRAEDGILEVEYGYYPQTVPSKDIRDKVLQAYRTKTLLKTGNTFTTDATKVDDEDKPFNPITHEEYEFEGKRYVIIEVNAGRKGYGLFNGEWYFDGDLVCVEVLPVKWWVDEKAMKMIPEKLIAAGVRFIDLEIFLNKYLLRDLEQQRRTINIVGNTEQAPQPASHRKEEAQKYAEDGLYVYGQIGENYSGYITNDKPPRGEDNVRN